MLFKRFFLKIVTISFFSQIYLHFLQTNLINFRLFAQNSLCDGLIILCFTQTLFLLHTNNCFHHWSRQGKWNLERLFLLLLLLEELGNSLSRYIIAYRSSTSVISLCLTYDVIFLERCEEISQLCVDWNSFI